MTLVAYLSVLKNTDFTKLWVSQLCSQLTNFLLSYAVLIKVFRLTESSLAVSLIILSFGAATLVFGAFAGVYADRFDRKWIMTIVNFAQAAVLGLFLLSENNFWALAGVTFLYSSLNQFYLPSEAPSIPNLVKKEQVLIANSYFSFTANGSMVLGFAAAGPIVSYFGFQAIFFIGMVLLGIAGIATLSLPALKPNLPKFEFLENVWHEFKGGVRYFWNDQFLHFPLIALILGQLINGILIMLAPVFVDRWLGLNLERGSFLVIAPLGLGILLGALSLGFQNRFFSRHRLVAIGFAGMGLMIASFGLLNDLPFRFAYYFAAGLLAGFFNAHIFAPAHALLQTYANETARGRIYGALYVFLQASATLPTVLVGAWADAVSLKVIFLSLGLLMLLFAYGFYRTSLTKSSA